MTTPTRLRQHWGHTVPRATNGASQLPIPWPSGPAEAYSDAFKAKVQAYGIAQTKANQAAARAKPAVAATPAAGASNPSPVTQSSPDTASAQAGEPAAIEPAASVASIADRMRARHAASASSSAPAARPAEAGLADRMRARFGLSADAGTADREPEPEHVALKTAGR